MEAWQEKVLKDLKGKPYEKLLWTTADGFRMAPMLGKDAIADHTGATLPGQPPYRRGSVFRADEPGWQIVQIIATGAESETRLTEALQAEVGAIRLEGDQADFLPLIDRVNLSQTAIHLAPDAHQASISEAIISAATLRDTPLAHITGTYRYDAVTQAALSGNALSPDALTQISQALSQSSQLPFFRTLGIDLCPIGDQGGTAGLQLAVALAATVEYLDLLPQQEASLTVETLAENLHYIFPVGGSFFIEVAKFRAFRPLIHQCLKAYSLDSPGLLSPFVTAKSSIYSLSHYDKYNNLLRHTTAAMSAVIGGAEAIAIDAFDKLEETNTKTGSRLARNIQFILQHESYLDQVQDVGGGSYYVEDLTDKLAKSAWTLFQEIEAAGGLLAYAQAGTLASILEDQQASKKEKFQRRKSSLIGVNQSPNPEETLDVMISPTDHRQAVEFERLRLKVDAIGRSRNQRLTAFFWQFGEVRMRNARAQFSRGLLAAGGFAVIDNQHPDDLERSWEEFYKSGADVLVLCSADAAYLTTGKELISRVHAVKTGVPVIIAGKQENLADTGATACIYAGMNAYDFLEELQKRWS